MSMVNVNVTKTFCIGPELDPRADLMWSPFQTSCIRAPVYEYTCTIYVIQNTYRLLDFLSIMHTVE